MGKAGITSCPRDAEITTGSQQGLQLAAQLLLDESGEICVEEPGYLGSLLGREPSTSRRRTNTHWAW